jgi:signal transduction histidine kinase/ligand-binding sensor domain-containing protein
MRRYKRKGPQNNNKYQSIQTLVLFLFLPILAIANEFYKPHLGDPMMELWRWHSYPELKNESIWMISEERKGVMWFKGEKSLCRYDGLHWTFYNRENSVLSLKDELSSSPLCFTETGKVYIGDNFGICKLAGETWKRIFPPDHDFKWTCFWIIEASDSALWVGMEIGILRIKNGIYFLYTSKKIKERLTDKVRFLQVKVLPELPLQIQNAEIFENVRVFEINNKLWFFIRDHEGNNCLLHSKYPTREIENKSSWILITEKDGLQIGANMNILEAKDGTIWFASSETQKGIYTYDAKTENFSRVKELDKLGIDYRTYSITKDKDGTIWIGDWGKILRYKEGKWKVYTSEELPIPKVDMIIYPTREGDIWLGGRNQDIFKVEYTDERWLTYEGLNFQCETDEKVKWFLTPEGKTVSKKDNNWLEYGPADGLITTPVVLKYTKSGILWAAGSHKGKAATAYFKNNKWIKQIHPDLSWGVGHLAVCELLDGSILFGSGTECQDYRGGIKRYEITENGEKWSHYTEPILTHTINYTIKQTPDNIIWIGGMNLSRFNGEKAEVVSNPERLGVPWISYLYTTQKGELWVSKHGAGLFHFDGKNWKNYTVEDYLASNTISSIIEWGKNIILASTNEGISAFDGKGWTRNAFSGHFPIPLEAGLLKKDHDGDLWINLSSREWYFRGLTGKQFNKKSFTDFKTIRYRKDTLPPETEITFGFTEVGYEGNTTISWKGKDAWNTTSSGELEFSFRLNNGPWSAFSRNKEKLLLRLASGNYRFEVRARDTDFNIDPTPTGLNFVVAAPFWKQLWFLLSIGALLGLVSHLMIRTVKSGRELAERNIRLEETARALENSNKELKQFAHIISHDLKVPLRGVNQLAEWTLDDYSEALDKKGKKNLELLKKRTKFMNDMIQALLEYSKIGRDKSKIEDIDFNKLLEETIVSLSPPENIKIIIENKLPKYKGDKTLSSKIFENLLSNAIKYADKNEVIIKINCVEEDNKWKFSVSDNGAGIEKKYFDKIFQIFETLDHTKTYESIGIGLTMAKKIVETEGGKIWVESEKGSGATFYFTLPK